MSTKSPSDTKKSSTTSTATPPTPLQTKTEKKERFQDHLFALAQTGKLQDLKEKLIDNKKLNVSKLRDRNERTILHVAVLNGHIPVIKHLLTLESDPNAVDQHKQSVLHYATHTGDSDVLDLLKKHDVNFNSKDVFGRTALHHASMQGSVSSVQWLVDNALGRSDTLMTWINQKDMLGSNALHWAAVKGKHDVVKFLVARGINVHLHAGEKQTAASLASRAEKEKVYSWLKEYIVHGSNLMTYVRDRLSKNNKSTLDEVRKHLSNLVKSFDKWSDKERSTGSFIQFYRNRHGLTALHVAAKYGDYLIVSELIHTHHFCISSKDLYGRTPLHYAALYGKMKVALLLTHLRKGYREEDTYRHFVKGDFTSGLSGTNKNGTADYHLNDYDEDVRVAHWKLKTCTDLLPSQMASHGYQHHAHNENDLSDKLNNSETDHRKSMDDYLMTNYHLSEEYQKARSQLIAGLETSNHANDDQKNKNSSSNNSSSNNSSSNNSSNNNNNNNHNHSNSTNGDLEGETKRKSNYESGSNSTEKTEEISSDSNNITPPTMDTKNGGAGDSNDETSKTNDNNNNNNNNSTEVSPVSDTGSEDNNSSSESKTTAQQDEKRTSESTSSATDENSSFQDVRNWLEKAGVAQYTEIFLKNGWETTDALILIQETDLKEMGVKPGHCAVILKNIQERKGLETVQFSGGRMRSGSRTSSPSSTNNNSDPLDFFNSQDSMKEIANEDLKRSLKTRSEPNINRAQSVPDLSTTLLQVSSNATNNAILPFAGIGRPVSATEPAIATMPAVEVIDSTTNELMSSTVSIDSNNSNPSNTATTTRNSRNSPLAPPVPISRGNSSETGIMGDTVIDNGSFLRINNDELGYVTTDGDTAVVSGRAFVPATLNQTAVVVKRITTSVLDQIISHEQQLLRVTTKHILPYFAICMEPPSFITLHITNGAVDDWLYGTRARRRRTSKTALTTSTEDIHKETKDTTTSEGETKTNSQKNTNNDPEIETKKIQLTSVIVENETTPTDTSTEKSTNKTIQKTTDTSIDTSVTNNNSKNDEEYENTISNMQVAQWAKQLASAISHLHAEKIIHSDIRAGNVLIDENMEIKLTGFLIHKPSEDYALASSCLHWEAPEAFRHEITEYTKRSDSYMFALTLYEMAVRNKPWGELTGKEVRVKVLAKERPSLKPLDEWIDGFSGADSMKSIVKKCWDDVPESRMEVWEIHDVLTQMHLDCETMEQRVKKSKEEEEKGEEESKEDTNTTEVNEGVSQIEQMSDDALLKPSAGINRRASSPANSSKARASSTGKSEK